MPMATKRITFSVDDELYEVARRIALAKGTTVDELARRWLIAYAEAGPEPAPRTN
jgi:hypothetical protein